MRKINEREHDRICKITEETGQSIKRIIMEALMDAVPDANDKAVAFYTAAASLVQSVGLASSLVGEVSNFDTDTYVDFVNDDSLLFTAIMIAKMGRIAPDGSGTFITYSPEVIISTLDAMEKVTGRPSSTFKLVPEIDREIKAYKKENNITNDILTKRLSAQMASGSTLQ